MSSQFGPYWLLRRIGHGDLAEVFVAVRAGDEDEPAVAAADHTPGHLVAVKRIWREMARYAEVHQLLAEEGALAAQLQHGNVARVFDVGAVGGRPYICMEYVPGADLAHLVERAQSAGLDPGCAARVVLDIAAALAYVHEMRTTDGRIWHVVHGDVTPTNILVSTSGVSKLIDFSVAMLRETARPEGSPATPSIARPATVRGTYAYMSPEQARGEEIDARTDVFALGVVLWELLSGRRLFRRKANYLTLAAVVEDPAPALSEVGVDLGAITPTVERILARALAKRREERYASIAELAVELADAAQAASWDVRAWTLQTRVRQLLSERRSEPR